VKAPRVEVVCVGTELLTGKINTHTAYLGQAFSTIGLEIWREQTVSDDPKSMAVVFASAWRSAEIVISCGGLGPTFDDLTRDVWSRVVGRPLRIQSTLVADIRNKFRQRGIVMPPQNRRQGYILAGAQVLSNAKGTAPGQILSIGQKTLLLLPGPSNELIPMVESQVLRELQNRYPLWSRVQKSFHMVGVPESRIDQLIRPLVRRLARVGGCYLTHGILASKSIITVKFSVSSRHRAKAELAATRAANSFRKVLKPYLFGEDDATLAGVIGEALRRKKLTVVTAESCTGGLVAKLLTDVPGSSDYFLEGAVTYSNRAKARQLGVSRISLEKFGAVSSQIAKEMAEGYRRKTGAAYGASVTGIAGPGGGSKEKPVGLVFIGCAGPKRTVVRKFQFNGDREWIRHRAALMALDLLRKEI
jgi:nicotinamide-nucleotide amidase